MTGCRFNAKNTLPKNYLGLAEKAGAKVFPLTTVEKIEELADGSWKITAQKSTAWFGGKRTFTAGQVVMAAGTFNTQKLLKRWVWDIPSAWHLSACTSVRALASKKPIPTLVASALLVTVVNNAVAA